MSESTCPCCGGHISGPTPIGVASFARLSKTQQRIVEALTTAYPREVESYMLAEIVWADDPNGGPNGGVRTLDVHVHKANKAIAGTGWRIVGRYRGGRRLEFVGAEAA